MAKRVPLFWKLAVESNELRCFHAPGSTQSAQAVDENQQVTHNRPRTLGIYSKQKPGHGMGASDFLSIRKTYFLRVTPTKWHFLTDFLTFYLNIFWHSLWHSIWYIFGDSLWLRSGREHSDPELAVRVWRGTLRSSACSWVRRGTLWSWVAVRVRGTLRSSACSWGPAEEEEAEGDIDSNNPHLTGGEKNMCQYMSWICVVRMLPPAHMHWFFRPTTEYHRSAMAMAPFCKAWSPWSSCTSRCST